MMLLYARGFSDSIQEINNLKENLDLSIHQH